MTERDSRRARDQEDPARRRPRPGEAGFTMLELLVVITILGALAAVVGVVAINQLGRARSDTAKLQIDSISTGLELFYLDYGRYPTQDEGLTALIEAPGEAEKWRGPYLQKKEKAITDPWGRVYLYRSPGQHGKFDLYSLGADNTEGGEDEDSDVTSW